MEAHPRSPRVLFEGKEHYEIPPFQRPYVWNEEDQWAPLWDDVLRVAESYIAAKESGTEPAIRQHFLGAVVYVTRPPVTGDVTRHEVIDGQQRMTSLYGVVRGHPPKFFDGNAQAFTGLRFHLESEVFGFFQPLLTSTSRGPRPLHRSRNSANVSMRSPDAL